MRGEALEQLPDLAGFRNTIAGRSVRGGRTPLAGFDGMSSVRTAASSAAERKPCLLAMVLPDAPFSYSSSTQAATSSGASSSSGIGPRVGAMSLRR